MRLTKMSSVVVLLNLIFMGYFIKPILAGESRQDTVLWSDACDQVAPWQASLNALLESDDQQLTHTQGIASLKITCSRKPGMLDDKQFNGWYRIHRVLPNVQVTDTDVICLSYRYDIYEPYYPRLYFILVDTDGSRWMFEWGGKDDQSTQWAEVRLSMNAGKEQTPGKVKGLGQLKLIEFAFNYRWFKQNVDYVRWIDDVRIVRLRPDDKLVTNEKQPALEEAAPTRNRTLPVNIQSIQTKPTLFVRKLPTLTIDNALQSMRTFEPDADTQDVGMARYESFLQWSGKEDFSANLRMFWNEQGLWVGTDVSDESVVSQSLSQQDFGDCDYWRLYFDMGLESAMNGANFDLNDYIFAATPTSSRHKPLINSVNYGGFVHAMQDEDRVFDPNTIGIRSQVNDKGYQLAVHMPSDLMRDFEPHLGKQFAFTCVWGDIDNTGRDCEAAWPTPTSSDYWRNLANSKDAVLIDEHGGAAWRVDENHINRGKPLAGYITGLYRNLHGAVPPQGCILSIKALDKQNKVACTWESGLKFSNQATSWAIDLNTTQLDGGVYQLQATIKGGTWQWNLMPWAITVNAREQHQWLAQLQQQYQLIKQRIKTSQQKVTQLAKSVGSTQYLDPYLGVLNVMDNILRFHFKSKNYTQAESLLVELEDILSTLENKLKEPYCWAGPAWQVHMPHVGPGAMPVLRDGAFMVNDQPVIYTGVMGRPVRNFYPEIIKQVGFNAVSLTQHYNSSVPGKFEEAAWSDEGEKHFTQDTQQFRRLDLNISHLSVSIHAATAYVRADPLLSLARGHFLPFDIASPRIMQLAQAYYKSTFPGLDRTLPDALTYCLLNEPAFEALSPAGIQQYQQWLMQRYVSLDAINKQWGSNYRTFTDIPSTRDDKSEAARYDWIVFNQSVLTGFASQLRDLSNAYDPSHKPKHVKLMSHTFRGNASTVLGGIDELAMANQFDVIGFDGGLSPVYLDFIRPLATDKPLYNSETHIHWTDPQGIRSEMFEGAIRGVDGSALWLWDPPWGAWGKMENYPFQQPRGLLSAGLTSLDLQRFATPLHAMSMQKAKIALLYSLPARVFNYDRYVASLNAVHEALRWCNMPVEVMHETILADKRWGDIKLIIMPSSAYISQQTYLAIGQFATQGGQVILVDPDANWHEPYGKTLPTIKAPNVFEVSIKKMDDKQLFEACTQWVAQAGITSDVVINPAIRGISSRTVTCDGSTWVYINNTTSEPQSMMLSINGQPVQGMDRILQQPVSKQINLAAHQIRMIQVTH